MLLESYTVIFIETFYFFRRRTQSVKVSESFCHQTQKQTHTYLQLPSASIDAANKLMLRSVNYAALARLFWRITLNNILFLLTRLLPSYCDIMTPYRLHSQTVTLRQCTEAMYCRFTPRVGTAEGGM